MDKAIFSTIHILELLGAANLSSNGSLNVYECV